MGYCTLLPDTIKGINISSACKLHDNLCGMRGVGYNPLTTIKPFYDKLIECGLSKKLSIAITIGGTLGYLIKYPYLAYKKYQYRKNSQVTVERIDI